MTGLAATTAVRVTTRRRAVMKRGAVSEYVPLLLAVAVAIPTNGPVNGKSWRSSATGVRPRPLTLPVTVTPLPQTGRSVDAAIVTAVGTRGVVNERLAPRAMPAALVATARYS